MDSVKVGGAAAKAGVREGDQIVKINGMPVSSSNHFEVLRMISGRFFRGILGEFLSIEDGFGKLNDFLDGPNVALTLLGEPLSCDTCRPIFFESGFFEVWLLKTALFTLCLRNPENIKESRIKQSRREEMRLVTYKVLQFYLCLKT